MNIFEAIYWIGMVLEVIARAPFNKARKTAKRTTQLATPTEKALFGLLWVGLFIFPLIYCATNWLDFANYSLPGWMGWFGVFLLACAVLVFARAHIDLKSNWSPSLEIYEGHTLVTNGIYAYLRHPMYASQWLWAFAQILLLQNWLAGPIGLITTLPFYILRVRAEEKMMLDTFGDQYRQYREKTGGLFPKLKT